MPVAVLVVVCLIVQRQHDNSDSRCQRRDDQKQPRRHDRSVQHAERRTTAKPQPRCNHCGDAPPSPRGPASHRAPLVLFDAQRENRELAVKPAAQFVQLAPQVRQIAL
jgi:hypothetical protein